MGVSLRSFRKKTHVGVIASSRLRREIVVGRAIETKKKKKKSNWFHKIGKGLSKFGKEVGKDANAVIHRGAKFGDNLLTDAEKWAKGSSEAAVNLEKLPFYLAIGGMGILGLMVLNASNVGTGFQRTGAGIGEGARGLALLK